MPRSVGLVGLGAMGHPVAERLAAAGHETFCLDIDVAVSAALAERGVVPVGSAGELGARSDVVLVMVPTDDDVLAVCSLDDGVLARPRPDAVILICSSVRPETCYRVARDARARAVEVLDAALTGGVRAAEAGRINLLVGGPEAVLDRVRDVLAPWTATVHLLGELGAGQVGKTVNNLCHWAQLSAIVEALRLGQTLGVEPHALRAALLDGPAASRTLRDMELMRLTWHEKDLSNALAMAEVVGHDLPIAATVREAMRYITVADIAALYGNG